MDREVALNYRSHIIIQYLEKHSESWYNFANDTHVRGVPNGSIILVTECCRTAAWANAVYANSSLNGGLSFSGGAFSLSGELSVSAGVQHHGMAPVTRYEGPAIMDDSEAASLPKDQTIFISAYKVALRKWLGPKVMRAFAEPQSLGRDDPEDGSGGVPSDEGSPSFISEIDDRDSITNIQSVCLLIV